MLMLELVLIPNKAVTASLNVTSSNIQIVSTAHADECHPCDIATIATCVGKRTSRMIRTFFKYGMFGLIEDSSHSCAHVYIVDDLAKWLKVQAFELKLQLSVRQGVSS